MAPQWASPALTSQSKPLKISNKFTNNLPSETTMWNCFCIAWWALIWHYVPCHAPSTLASISHNSPFRHPVRWPPPVHTQVGHTKSKRAKSKLRCDPLPRLSVTIWVHTINEAGCGGWMQFRKKMNNSVERVWHRGQHRNRGAEVRAARLEHWGPGRLGSGFLWFLAAIVLLDPSFYKI